MKHLWRKLVSVILALAMVVLCLPEYVRPVKTARAADGDITYTDENGQKVVLNNKDSDSTNNYTALREPGPTEFKDGMTYVWGDGSMNYQFLNYASKRIEVNGHVKLVVLEGYTLHYAYGLHVPKGSSLTIYGGGSLSCTLQQNDLVSEKTLYQAAIGGNASEDAGAISIVGCTVLAEGGKYAAGIGGGRASDRGVGGNCGTVTIYGGKVTANGDGGAAGIGGGRGGSGGKITINGGTVTANGGSYYYNYGYGSYSDYGAGIGGGSGKGFETITINGGTVNATGGQYAAGIGCGNNASEGTIVINGGAVTATSGNNGSSGIGSGTNYGNTSVTINGGTIVARRGNDGGNGIGGNIRINLSDKTSSVTSSNYRGSVALGNPVRIDGTNTIIAATQEGETLGNTELNQIANKKIVSGRTFKITWIDGNGATLKTEQVGEGVTPEYSGETPTKNPSDKFQYSFNNTWSPDVEEASADATYTAQFTETLRNYSVTFEYRDAKGDFQSANDTYQYGTLLSSIAPREIPTEPKNPKNTWTYTGWNFATDAVVTGEATYTAQYDEVTNQYKVTLQYLDEKGEVKKSEQAYDYGTKAANIALPEEVPAKAVTKEVTYTFAGWPQFADVTDNVTYQATYDEAPTQYTVTLKYRDASGELKEFVKSYDYNTPATEIVLPESVPGTVVTKATTYTFTGWPEFSDVTDNATYVADYSTAATQYTVTLKYLGTDGKYKEYAKSYDYNTPGTDISLPGNVPTTVVTKAITYTLQGWPEFADVTDDVVYTASYSEATTQYTVKFTYIENEQSKTIEKHYDYDTSDVTIANAAPDVPDRDTEWVYYEFIGWDKEFVPVAEDIEYIAQYKEYAKYGINIGSTPNGVISSDYATALPNTTITLTLTPNGRYEFKADSLKVLKETANIDTTFVEDSEEIQFTFTMPEGNVDVSAYFYRVYQLWLGEVQVTEFNQNDILGDGNVTYVQDENNSIGTLTFAEKKPAIEGLAELSAYEREHILIATAKEVEQLRIVAPKGLELSSDAAHYGILGWYTSIEVQGDLSITLDNADAEAGAWITQGELSIHGNVTVNTANGYGLVTNGGNTVGGVLHIGLIIDGNVSVVAKGQYGLYASGAPLVVRGDINAVTENGWATYSGGRHTQIEGKITVSKSKGGIYVSGGELSIIGDVTIDASDSGIYVGGYSAEIKGRVLIAATNGTGIYIGGGGLKISAPPGEQNKDEVTVNITAARGIYDGGSSIYAIDIEGNVKVTTTQGQGIVSSGMSTVILGNVDIVSDCTGNSESFTNAGVASGGGNITVQGNTVVKVKNGHGMYAGGGSILCSGTVNVTTEGGSGIYSGGGNITIQNDTTVLAKGGDGIYAGGGSIICEGTVTVTADGGNGIYAAGGYIDVKGSVVVSLLNGHGNEYGLNSSSSNKEGYGTRVGRNVTITADSPIACALFSVYDVLIENKTQTTADDSNAEKPKAVDIAIVSGSGIHIAYKPGTVQGDVSIVVTKSRSTDHAIEADNSGLDGLTINGNVTVKMLGEQTENNTSSAAVNTHGATIRITGDVDIQALSCSGIIGDGGNIYLTGNVNVFSGVGYGINCNGFETVIDASGPNQSVTVKSAESAISANTGSPMKITSRGDIILASDKGYGIYESGGSLTINIVNPEENKPRGILSVTSEKDGILCGSGLVTISGDLTVEKAGGSAVFAPGGITITGNIEIKSCESGLFAPYGSIQLGTALKDGKQANTITINSSDRAIYACADIVLNGNTVIIVNGDTEDASVDKPAVALEGSLSANGSISICNNIGGGIVAKNDITIDGDVTVETGKAIGIVSCGKITVVDGVWHVLTEEGIAMCGTDIVIPNTHGIAIPTDGEFAPYTFENPFKEDEEVEGIAVFAPAEDGTATIATEAMISKFIEITFVDEDENKIKSYNAFQGLRPKFDGEEPKKEKDKQYSYSYGGWTDGENEYAPDELPVVTKPVTYKVVFAKTLNKYTITFLAEDGSKLSEKQYDYGTEAKDIEVPADQKKSDTKELTFVFAGWNDGTNTFKADKIPAVIGDATYKAQFSDTTRNYKVTFVDEDGTTVILAAKEYKYGTKAADVTKPADPTKKEDDEFTYEFVGWTPEITDVESDATYKATYKAIAKPGVYYLVGGGTPSVKKGGENGLEMQFKRTVNDTITFDQFDGILINGTELSKDKYTATKGSVIIKISQAYIDSLADGKSELTVKFKDGDPVKVSVEILPAQSSETDPEKTDEKTDSPTSPKTDDTMVLAWLIFLLGAASFTVVLMAKKRDEMAR